MAVTRKTSRVTQARRKAVKIVRKIKTKPSSTPVSFNSILVFILFGFFFGYFLSNPGLPIMTLFRICSGLRIFSFMESLEQPFWL